MAVTKKRPREGGGNHGRAAALAVGSLVRITGGPHKGGEGTVSQFSNAWLRVMLSDGTDVPARKSHIELSEGASSATAAAGAAEAAAEEAAAPTPAPSAASPRRKQTADRMLASLGAADADVHVGRKLGGTRRRQLAGAYQAMRHPEVREILPGGADLPRARPV